MRRARHTIRAPFMMPGERRWTWLTWETDAPNKHAAVRHKADELGAVRWSFDQAEYIEGGGSTALARNSRLPGGLAEKKGVTARDVDRSELQRGARHELEHTSDRALATEIALDHLAEDPEYYTHLDACEKQLAPNAREFWVWPLRRGSDEPLASEGPWGPYDLTTAKYYARIGAQEGAHDRVVTHGREPRSLTPMRRYKAGTGEPI